MSEIGPYAFGGCVGLENIKFPDTLKNLGTENSGGYQFDGCAGLRGKLTIPQKFNAIGEGSFQGATKCLEEIECSADTLYEYCFCASLDSDTTIPFNLKKITFTNTTSSTTFKFYDKCFGDMADFDLAAHGVELYVPNVSREKFIEAINDLDDTVSRTFPENQIIGYGPQA
ncbi:hypothetical protein FACS189459_6980 [Bacilli bacterium]|nr:hypothetical protein FACS189459_6980 [Bacilli bacterium]